MIKRSLLFFFLLSCCLQGKCQDAYTDSLLHLIQTEKTDSLKVDLLCELSENATDDKILLDYSRQALELAQKINYKKGIAEASNNIGYYYGNRGDLLIALEYYNESLAIRRQINDKKGIAVSLSNIGNIYTSQGNYKKAMEYTLESLKIIEETKDSFVMAVLYNNLATLYSEDGNSLKAMDYHEASLKIKQKLNDFDGIVQTYNNMAYIFSEQGNTDRAIDYYKKSIQICDSTGNKTGAAQAYNNIGYLFSRNKRSFDYYFKSLKLYQEVGNKEGIATVYNNIGVAYSSLNDNDKALEYYNKSLILRMELGSKGGISNIYINIGKIHEEKGEFKEAISFYEKGLAIKKEIGSKQGISTAQNNIGNIYYRLKKYKEAESFCKQSLILGQQLGYPLNIMNASFALSNIYAATGNYKEAYKMHVLFKEMADSVSYSESQKSTTSLQMSFEFEKKEARILSEHEKREAISKKEIEKQKVVRNYTAAGFSLLLLGSGVFVFLYTQRKKSQFQQTVSEVEMKALRAQMNPHFIFNSLNSIKRYMHEHDAGTADEYLTKFAKVMRLILENSQFSDVLLAEDLKALTLYMQLESLRMKNKFTFEIEIADDIDAENTLVPPLILQPFVENAIWHGFSNKEGPGKIIIRILKVNDMIQCIVEDNGIGRKKSQAKQVQNTEKKSLGMKITRSRIAIINKIKKVKASVELIDLEEGMKVVVNLPLVLDF